MSVKYCVFVEGVADKRFFENYLTHLRKKDQTEIIDCKGYTSLANEEIQTKLIKNHNNDIVNLIIFDTDENFTARKKEIEAYPGLNLVAGVFLLPNDNDTGALEDLLEQIINPINQPVMDCWEKYEAEISKTIIPGRIPVKLIIPAMKTKIYGYLEVLLGETKAQKEKIKEPKREYNNIDHWDLDSIALNKIKEFIELFIK